MPENVTETVEPQNQAPEFEAITSQEALDKIIQKRIARERNKYADYEDLAAKAAKFDEAVEANKTELVKAVERAQVAEQALVDSGLEMARLKVIAEYGIPSNAQKLISAASEEEMREQAEEVARYIQSQPNLRQVVSTDGKIPARKPRSTADQFADAFQGRI